MLVEGIPSHLVQSMAFVQSNINSIMSGISQAPESPSMNFENILSSTFEDNDSSSFNDVKMTSQPYQNSTSVSTPSNLNNVPTNTIDKILNDKNLNNESTKNVVQDAYSSLLNGNVPSSSLSSVSPNALSSIGKASISDKEFFNAEALTPEQITGILKKKGSPFANQTYEGGKSVGQLIYDYCHQAGTLAQGSKTINPAMIVSIMGAESTFGTDSKNPSNPFNIRINGSFSNTNSFESSLKTAINTMYNWAVSKPSNVNIPLFDYAGDKYCENYRQDWKPNVEKYYSEFSSLNLFDNDKLDMVKNILAKTNNNSSNGINVNSLMAMLNNSSSGGSNMLSSLGSLPSSNLLNSFEDET